MRSGCSRVRLCCAAVDGRRIIEIAAVRRVLSVQQHWLLVRVLVLMHVNRRRQTDITRSGLSWVDCRTARTWQLGDRSNMLPQAELAASGCA